MKTPTKFVKDLTDKQRLQLTKVNQTDKRWRTRQRAQAILLSARGFSIDQLAVVFDVDRDRVSVWLDRWEAAEFDGLTDEPRSGRPAIFATARQKKSSCFGSPDAAFLATLSAKNRRLCQTPALIPRDRAAHSGRGWLRLEARTFELAPTA